ncbi:MAG: patatin family protein, partial [Treponema sp.]|nr:patatin family protein [Treponema sp.]
NEEKAYTFNKEKSGEALIICPETELGISRTENNPDELQRVYEEGRRIALKKLDEVKSFFEK